MPRAVSASIPERPVYEAAYSAFVREVSVGQPSHNRLDFPRYSPTHIFLMYSVVASRKSALSQVFGTHLDGSAAQPTNFRLSTMKACQWMHHRATDHIYENHSNLRPCAFACTLLTMRSWIPCIATQPDYRHIVPVRCLPPEQPAGDWNRRSAVAQWPRRDGLRPCTKWAISPHTFRRGADYAGAAETHRHRAGPV